MDINLENSDFTQPGPMAGVWRALDASANRAGEALRVIEDVVRFVFSDLHLTQLAKDLRHDLTAVLARESLQPRLCVRDLPGDVGVDVAVASGADGAHTGSGDLSTVLTRRVIGARCLLGRTAHSLAEARAAVIEGADYLGVGPCFLSTTKSFATCAPPEFLSTVAAEVSLPQFAIGGISLEHLERITSLGIRRVAVASAVVSADDPARAAIAIMDRLMELQPSLVARATKPL